MKQSTVKSSLSCIQIKRLTRLNFLFIVPEFRNPQTLTEK